MIGNDSMYGIYKYVYYNVRLTWTLKLRYGNLKLIYTLIKTEWWILRNDFF